MQVDQATQIDRTMSLRITHNHARWEAMVGDYQQRARVYCGKIPDNHIRNTSMTDK